MRTRWSVTEPFVLAVWQPASESMVFPKAVHLGTAAAAQSILTRSKAAVERLRAYRLPAAKVWDTLPVSRRAAVLILLYADKKGDLRMVITMRAASLRSFSGMFAVDI